MKNLNNLIAILLFITLCFACKDSNKTSEQNTPANTPDTRYTPKPYVEVKHPDWSKNATIYEANIRQFTPEGTFKAFEAHLPRLKEMGRRNGPDL